LFNATAKLYNYFQYYDFGNPRLLRQDFIKSCDGGVCSDSIKVLLQSLSGELDPDCDMLAALYDGYPDQGFYQGHRDYMTNVAAYVLDIAMLGITAQSGYMSFNNANTETWRIE
jgi:hypothetical protein